MSTQAEVARWSGLLLYLTAMVAAMVLVDQDTANSTLAVIIWGAATLLFGWLARNPFFGVLALLAIPISIPFGYPEHYLGSDPSPLWWFGAGFGALSGAVIALVAMLRLILEVRRRR